MADWIYKGPDDGVMGIIQCKCGHQYEGWGIQIHRGASGYGKMPCCGRRAYYIETVVELSSDLPEGNKYPDEDNDATH